MIAKTATRVIALAVAYLIVLGGLFVNPLFQASATDTVGTVIIGGQTYNVRYTDQTDAGDVQVNDALTVVTSANVNGWTDPFDAQNTTEVVVVNNVVTEIGTAASGTYIPINGFVMSGTGDKKSVLDALNVGETVSFTNPPTLTFQNTQILYDAQSLAFDQTNAAPAADKLTLYDKNYTKPTTGTGSTGFEVAFDANGAVVSVGGSDNQIPSAGFVLSGLGKGAAKLQAIDFTGMKAEINDAKTAVLVYTTPQIKLDAAKETIAQNQTAEANAKTQLLDLPFANIDTAVQNANGKAAAAEDALNVGTNSAKKAAYFTTVQAALSDLNSSVNQIAQLIIPSAAIEDRAAWVQPSETNADAVRAVLQKLKSANFNTVYVSAWIDGFTTFKSSNSDLQMLPALQNFDALNAYVQIGHELGMTVYAWVDGLRIGTGTSSLALKDPNAYLAKAHPEWLLYSRNGTDGSTDTVKKQITYYIDPMNEEAAALVTSVYREIVTKYQVDGVQYDNMEFPQANAAVKNEPIDDFGYNSDIMDAYTKQYHSMPFLIDNTSSEWDQWCQFKAQQVSNFLYTATMELQSLRSNLKISATADPDFTDAITNNAQDSSDWVAKGYVDSLVIQPFTNSVDAVVSAASATSANLNGQAYLTTGLDATGDVPASIVSAEAQALRKLGYTGIALYSYTEMLANNDFATLQQGLFRDPTLALPENVKDSIPAALTELKRKLNTVYSVYDAGNQAEYSAFATKVQAVSDELKTADDSQQNLNQMVSKLNSLVTDASSSITSSTAKNLITADLNQAIGWLNVAIERGTSRDSHKLTNLTFDLALGDDDTAPAIGKAYAFTVKGQADFSDYSVSYLLSSGQYTLKPLTKNVAVTSDGKLKFTGAGVAKVQVSLTNKYQLSLSDPGKVYIYTTNVGGGSGSGSGTAAGNGTAANKNAAGVPGNPNTGESTASLIFALFALTVVSGLTGTAYVLKKKKKA